MRKRGGEEKWRGRGINGLIEGMGGRGKCWGRVGGEDMIDEGGGLGGEGRVSRRKYENETAHTSRKGH